MKRILIMLLISFTFTFVIGTVGYADMAKEGTSTGTMAFSGTFKMIATEQERIHMIYEMYGLEISDMDTDPTHNTTFRCLGSLHAVKGVFNDSGFCVNTLSNKDKAYSTYEGTGELGGGSKGTYTWTGGTGKFSGIEGGGEYKNISLPPSAEGTFQGYSKLKSQWKIP
jgi:hypothetical protein